MDPSHPLMSPVALGPTGSYVSGRRPHEAQSLFETTLQAPSSAIRQRTAGEMGSVGNAPGSGRPPPKPGPKSTLDPVNAKVNPWATAEGELAQVVSKREFTAVWLGSTAAFVSTMLVWAYAFMNRPIFCVIWSTLGIVYCVLILVLKRQQQHLYHPLALLGIVCVAVGSVVGLYVYDTCTIFPAFYGNSRTYYNVVANQPANSVADAGKLTFASETFVDTTQAAGIITEDGSVYCAAPIRDGTGISRLQFWAVGTGCCEGVGEFTCDEVGNKDAKAGIVVFDNNNYFGPSRFTNYEKARQKAQATFGLQSVSSVAYVRWVMEGDLDMVASSYRWTGWFAIVIFSVIGLALIYVFTAFIYLPAAAAGGFRQLP
eukprot:TRINITY_DN121962_c0_g1_i1.p1 TRINITY_DN121962_c0_g1~~TRINITY_DN121962_c0_g1_i1.p1  ORF type:complete len:372 (-),score=69.88 TRINITY_DN121962_c0_g1_i1:89-1204(-)